uniref:F-box domain-containing protein n=1 Tax=Hordeum vulgare subsp. vulgare TaxID=112509 RepID=A0A8I6XV76_HORVV
MPVSLPHDLLLDILLRVDDAAALFRCAAACRQWHGLVADPAMLRRRWPEDRCPSLAGFFIKNRARNQEAKALVPTPRSPQPPLLRAHRAGPRRAAGLPPRPPPRAPRPSP